MYCIQTKCAGVFSTIWHAVNNSDRRLQTGIATKYISTIVINNIHNILSKDSKDISTTSE